MRLTEHFHLEEFTRSKTAREKGIKNVPDVRQIQNLSALCKNVLEPIRKHFGKPIFITSGFRSKNLNRVIGGSMYSQHMNGEAADFVVKDIPVKVVFEFVRSFDHLVYDQVILEKKGKSEWLHISYKNNRKENLMAEPDGDGRMKYRAVE